MEKKYWEVSDLLEIGNILYDDKKPTQSMEFLTKSLVLASELGCKN